MPVDARMRDLRKKPLTPSEFKLLWRCKNAGLYNIQIGIRFGLSATQVSRIVARTHDYMSKG